MQNLGHERSFPANLTAAYVSTAVNLFVVTSTQFENPKNVQQTSKRRRVLLHQIFFDVILQNEISIKLVGLCVLLSDVSLMGVLNDHTIVCATKNSERRHDYRQ